MRTGHVLFSCASEKKKRFDKAAALRLKTVKQQPCFCYRCGMVSRFYKNILLSSEKACILISASGAFPNPYSAKMNGMPASLHALASP